MGNYYSGLEINRETDTCYGSTGDFPLFGIVSDSVLQQMGEEAFWNLVHCSAVGLGILNLARITLRNEAHKILGAQYTGEIDYTNVDGYFEEPDSSEQ